MSAIATAAMMSAGDLRRHFPRRDRRERALWLADEFTPETDFLLAAIIAARRVSSTGHGSPRPVSALICSLSPIRGGSAQYTVLRELRRLRQAASDAWHPTRDQSIWRLAVAFQEFTGQEVANFNNWFLAAGATPDWWMPVGIAEHLIATSRGGT